MVTIASPLALKMDMVIGIANFNMEALPIVLQMDKLTEGKLAQVAVKSHPLITIGATPEVLGTTAHPNRIRKISFSHPFTCP